MVEVTAARDDGLAVRRGTSPYTPVKVIEKSSPLSRKAESPAALVTSTLPSPIYRMEKDRSVPA